MLQRHRRIAVTGLFNSGKTVFLTSLISQLAHSDPAHFHLGNEHGKTQRVGYLSHLPIGSKQVPFPYASNLNYLSRRAFPPKTTMAQHYALDVTYKEKHWLRRPRFRVELLDFPGERFADASMHGESYTSWSRFMLDDLDQHGPIKQYLNDLATDANLTDEVAVAAYKRLLESLVGEYRSLVSPSTYLLELDGRQLTKDAELMSGLCGVDSASEFVPLPDSIQARNADMVRRFQVRFKAYQQRIVAPVFRELATCDRLIILVDIPALLASGPEVLNDNVAILRRLFSQLDKRGNPLWQLFGRSLKKIAFVASKIDRIHPHDRDNANQLLKSLVATFRLLLPRMEIEEFLVSAAYSTRVNGDKLAGQLIYDDQGRQLPVDDPPREYATSSIPAAWPHSWRRGEFYYPKVYPDFPAAQFQAPTHVGLDAVWRFLVH